MKLAPAAKNLVAGRYFINFAKPVHALQHLS